MFLACAGVLGNQINDTGLKSLPIDPNRGSADTAPASQLNSRVTDEEVNKYYDNIIESNNLEEMPTEYRDATPSLPKPSDFDIERFLHDLDDMDCDESKKDHNDEEKYQMLCAKRIQEDTMRPAGEYGSDNNSFYEYLNKNIFMPLAYQVTRPQSLSDIIVNLSLLNKQAAVFEGRHTPTNYQDFERSIFTLFSRVQGNSSDVEQNQEMISELMIAILKRFHLYWNQLRYKNQIVKIKEDTKDIMRNILKEYQVKEKFLFEVTKTLVEHIKQAYMRFMKAHHSVRILNKTAPSMVSHAIIERYEKLLDEIKFSHFTQIKLVREVTYMLDLQEAFYVVNYKMGVNEPKSMLEFQTEVIENIQHSYNFYITQLNASDKERLVEIKHFTAVLLLKMKHMEYIIFRYHSITAFANMSKTMIFERDPIMVKLYYEILDNMLTIPKKCVNYLVLKTCALHETNKMLRYISSKYMLKRSNRGWLVFDYSQSVLKNLFSRANDLVFGNWTVFKAYFYQNLFSTMYNFKKRYYIGDEDCVEDLENMIGNSIDTFKEEEANHHIDFGIIDQLDKDLYEKFLDIKAFYNKFAPFDKDPQIASSIENDLTVFFVEFKQKYKNAISEDFIRLLERIKNAVDNWRMQLMAQDNMSIQVGTLPIGMGAVPQIFTHVNVNMSGSATDPGHAQLSNNDIDEKSSANQDKQTQPQPQSSVQPAENTDQDFAGEERRMEQVSQQTEREDESHIVKDIKVIRAFDNEDQELEEKSSAEEQSTQLDDKSEPVSRELELKQHEKSNENKPSPTDTSNFNPNFTASKQDMTIKPKVPDVWSLDNLIPNHAVNPSSQEKEKDQGLGDGIYFK